MDFDSIEKEVAELEQRAEAAVTKALGKYSVAAVTIGIVFAVLMLGFALLLFTSGSLLGAVFAAVVAAVILWLVTLLRSARAAIKAPLTP